MHTNKTPLLVLDAGGGGLPLTIMLPPNSGAKYGLAHIGNIIPTAIRIIASMMPIGIHRMIRRAVNAVGRLTRRPSWNITGRGRISWWSFCFEERNGGCICSYSIKSRVTIR